MTPCMVLLCMIFPLQEGSGFVAVKTGSLVIFGSYSSVMFPSVCVEAVERLGELDSQHGSHLLLLMLVYYIYTVQESTLEQRGSKGVPTTRQHANPSCFHFQFSVQYTELSLSPSLTCSLTHTIQYCIALSNLLHNASCYEGVQNTCVCE